MAKENREKFFMHEDDRRVLIEWISGMDFKSAKAIIAKNSSIIGDHYHEKKDEVLFLLSGKAKRVVIGGIEELEVVAPRKWFVAKGMHHVFELEKGSVLLSAATDVFDPNDELKNIKK